MDFMRNWVFSANGGEPICVDLPHDAMLSEKRTYATPNGEKTGYYPGGKYEYTKEFDLTAEEADGYVASGGKLELEGL